MIPLGWCPPWDRAVGEEQHPLYRELTTAIPRAEGDPDSFRERLRGFGIAANDDPVILAAVDEELAR